ncbi:MAG: hypothetical protein FWD67_12120 [Betaproteobacteria bacterium]|nr:hypothetical protein [Betaproteobacteria bacterium]
MSAPLFLELQKAGVHLSVSPSGELKAKGNPETLRTFLPIIRENKDALIADMHEAFEERAARAEHAGVSYWWRVRFPDGVVKEVFTLSPDTLEGRLLAYPGAVDAEPFAPDITPPESPMSATEEQSIRAWLDRIGEKSPEIIFAAIDAANRSAQIRAYCISQQEI